MSSCKTPVHITCVSIVHYSTPSQASMHAATSKENAWDALQPRSASYRKHPRVLSNKCTLQVHALVKGVWLGGTAAHLVPSCTQLIGQRVTSPCPHLPPPPRSDVHFQSGTGKARVHRSSCPCATPTLSKLHTHGHVSHPTAGSLVARPTDPPQGRTLPCATFHGLRCSPHGRIPRVIPRHRCSSAAPHGSILIRHVPSVPAATCHAPHASRHAAAAPAQLTGRYADRHVPPVPTATCHVPRVTPRCRYWPTAPRAGTPTATCHSCALPRAASHASRDAGAAGEGLHGAVRHSAVGGGDVVVGGGGGQAQQAGGGVLLRPHLVAGLAIARHKGGVVPDLGEAVKVRKGGGQEQLNSVYGSMHGAGIEGCGVPHLGKPHREAASRGVQIAPVSRVHINARAGGWGSNKGWCTLELCVTKMWGLV